MFNWRSLAEWKRLWRYYQAGVINMIFGFSLFALFVRLGMNVYVAQILSHVLGVIFNYFTYSRYAFADHRPSRYRFAVSYGANYLLGLAGLAVALRVFQSPYVAGFISTLVVSLLNYFVLRHLVFTEKAA